MLISEIMQYLVYSVLACVSTAFIPSIAKYNSQINRYSQRSLIVNLVSQLESPVTSSNAVNIDEFMNYWRKGYQTAKEEVCVVIPNTTIPNDLIGTYFKNGHAKFEVGKEKILHPFDGDGMISALTFQNNSLLFRNKFVRTKGFVKERTAKRVMYRNVFGTEKRGFLSNFFDAQLKNVANTNCLYGGGRLLALWEGGLPYRLEPDSLRTVGEYTFRGTLQSGYTFLAHPRYDSNTGNTVNICFKTRGKESSLLALEFDKDLNIVKQVPFDIPAFASFHDFSVTENYYVISQPPVKMDVTGFLLGFKHASTCLSYDKNAPTVIYLVPRKGNGPIEVVTVDNHFNYHVANAYEENGDVVVDIARSDELVVGELKNKEQQIWEYVDYANEVPYFALTRYKLTKRDGKWSYAVKQLSTFYADFVSVAPKKAGAKHRYVFGGAARLEGRSDPISGLIKLDCDTGAEEKWFGETYEFFQEPTIADKAQSSPPRSEDDVYVLGLLHNNRDFITEFVVFDGKNIAQGPISRTKLPLYIPFALHGTFAPDVVFDPEEVQRRWIACNALESKGWNKMEGGFSGLGIKYAFD